MGYATERFSKRLKELRETVGLTQEQLAKELKVSRGAISYYEKGERTPDIEFLDSVSMFFDLPLEYLMGFTDNIKREHQNMYEFYGLTDEACGELETPHSDMGHIISHIITNPSFFGIKHLIKTVLENYLIFSELETNYLNFILTEHLKALISEALKAELNKQYTENDIQQLHDSIDALFKQHYKAKEEYEKQELKLSEELDAERAERMKQRKSSIAYQARVTIHDKLSNATMHLDDE